MYRHHLHITLPPPSSPTPGRIPEHERSTQEKRDEKSKTKVQGEVITERYLPAIALSQLSASTQTRKSQHEGATRRRRWAARKEVAMPPPRRRG
jgi:hypothetical protein